MALLEGIQQSSGTKYADDQIASEYSLIQQGRCLYYYFLQLQSRGNMKICGGVGCRMKNLTVKVC